MSPTTPNLGLPYPVLADTADVPRDVKALADKLDVLLGGGGGGGGGTTVGAGLPVLEPGVSGQVRAGRQLTVADFTSLGLSTPAGLFNLSGLTNLGSGAPLVNLGAVPFDVGINGAAASSARFAGSTAQALYISDTGAADPFRIRTGSFGCWVRTAKRGVLQTVMAKGSAASWGFFLQLSAGNVAVINISNGATTVVGALTGVLDVCDDRWHFVVATFDGTFAALHVDGALEASALLTGQPAGSTGPLNIGGQYADSSTAATSPHYGRVDEAFVTADVLSEDQVRSLYAARLTHTLGVIPGDVRISVHRRRRGAALAVADFTTQPLRLHNFTGGALTDQGSNGQALAPTGVNAILPNAGADGSAGNGQMFTAIAHNGLASTDAGLPGGLTARSFGCWFKTTSTGTTRVVTGWGTAATASIIYMSASAAGVIRSGNGADDMVGPYAADGAWHHAVVVEDNAASDGIRRKFYVDGRLVAGSTVLNPITLGGANSYRVGANTDGANPWVGQIDGAFICGYALARDELARLYARGAQDLGASSKNAGDHVERVDATSVLLIADTLESQNTIDVGVMA